MAVGAGKVASVATSVVEISGSEGDVLISGVPVPASGVATRPVQAETNKMRARNKSVVLERVISAQL